jgi:uncharacterized protein
VPPTDPAALAHWRRTVAELYAAVRAEPDPRSGHDLWRRGRDELFRGHSQSPLAADDPLRTTGLPYFPYDPALRVAAPLRSAPPQTLNVTTSDGTVRLERAGRVTIGELGIRLDVWWLDQYGGGLFLPVRDATAAGETYGGGRYLLDTVKGADLGTSDDALVLDFNFLYHPSCRYSSDWSCPLAPEGNRTDIAIRAGERLSG